MGCNLSSRGEQNGGADLTAPVFDLHSCGGRRRRWVWRLGGPVEGQILLVQRSADRVGKEPDDLVEVAD